MVSPDPKMCQPLHLPLILCLTIGKNKNFSSSVIMYPKIFVLFEINIHHTTPIEYVITHEPCHLVHLNHTKEFYALLTNEMPHWKKVEKQVGKDDEVSPPYFFRYSFFTSQK